MADSNQIGLALLEIQVLKLLAAGMSDQQIAEKLNLSLPSVDWQIENLLQKSGCRTPTELVLWGVRLNIIYH